MTRQKRRLTEVEELVESARKLERMLIQIKAERIVEKLREAMAMGGKNPHFLACIYEAFELATQMSKENGQ